MSAQNESESCLSAGGRLVGFKPQSNRDMKRQKSNQRWTDQDMFAKQARKTSTESEVQKAARPTSPAPSCSSMKGNMSKNVPILFGFEKNHRKSTDEESPEPLSPSHTSLENDTSVEVAQQDKAERSPSPVPSCMSMKSDMSKNVPIYFGLGAKDNRKRFEGEGPEPLSPSCASQENDTLVDANKQEKAERSASPALSCTSMKSDMSKNVPIFFASGAKSHTKSFSLKEENPVSASPSHISIQNDTETNQQEKICGELPVTVPEMTSCQKQIICHMHYMPLEVFCRTDQTLMCKVCSTLEHRGHSKTYTALQDLDTVFLLEQTLHNIDNKYFMRFLAQNFPECFENPEETHDIHEMSQLMLERFGSEGALKVALKIMLEKGMHFQIIQSLKSKLQNHLKSNFKCIREGNAQQGNQILLNDIFTELLIMEGGDGEVNKEHEVRLIEEAAKNKDIRENAIQCNDIFKPLPGQRKRIRTVLTKGIAGIGKTVSVHKFILDWAERTANQDIDFMFPLPFRDLNLMGGDKYSVMELLHHYFPQLKELKTISSEETKTVFIFDGLDECRLPLDFKNHKMCCDLTEKIPVEVLLTNLIRGNLLPSALIWITSRPAAANQIPPECVNQVTEVRGFSDKEKEEYFRKRFSNQGLADKIIKHIKSSRSLHIMCHIPVFCWISATVLEKMLSKTNCSEVPKSLTQMYTHFLLIQIHLKNKKYHGVIQGYTELMESDKEMISKLAKLAFLQLEKGNLIFYAKDLTECGIDVGKASEYSAICTEIFKEEFGLYQEKVFCFVHLSIQEHLAALYVQLQFVKYNMNILGKEAERHDGKMAKMSDVHRRAVDRALQSENGQFDLFLRFLLGLSLESSQVLLKGLLSKSCSESFDETVDYIKEKINKESSAERTINLFHCLNELNYNSLVEEIHNFLRSGKQSKTELKPDQCSALAYVLLTSEDVMSEFDFKTCNTSAEGYRRLLPVVKTSKRAILAGVNLTDESCEILASVLQSATSHLTELDLSFNSLGDLGVKLLSAGLSHQNCKLEKLNLSHNELEHIGVKLLCDCLKSPQCKLQILGLAGTNFSERSCDLIASIFQSANSHLKEMDLGCNNMKDSGVKLLSSGLKSPHCQLEKLGLDRCDLTSCEALASVLQSPNSQMKELILSYNKLGDLGVIQLCEGLLHPDCKLEKLDLSYNDLGHSAVKLLCEVLIKPDCKLKSLRLADVGMPEEACETLASVLHSGNQHLKELDLSNNYIGDSGVERLCAGLKSPKCKLEKLSLSWCNLTDACCSNLSSVLSSQTCLRELELRDNDLQDSGVNLLSAGLQDPQCTLEKLGLSGCCVTEVGCSSLRLAISLNYSKLTNLDLSYNYPGELGTRQLFSLLNNPYCKLKKLSLEHGGECRNKPGLKKYACEITLDPNTAHRTLSLTGSKKVTMTKGEQPYPDHPDRFEYYAEVLCQEALSGSRFYWEAEWTGNVVYIGVTYKGINRKGRGRDCKLGMNNKSWILFCSNDYGYYVSYNNKETVVPTPPNANKRMGIYLDWLAGTLSYFIISPNRVYHTYTFHTTFTEPLYPGIRVYNYDDIVTLCDLK